MTSTPGTSTAASSTTDKIAATITSSEAATNGSSGAEAVRKQKVALSNVHKHFHQSMTGTDSNGNKLWSSKCKYCPSESSLGEYSSKSSSHLKTHLQKHHPTIARMVEEEDKKDRDSNSLKELAKDKQGRALDAFLDWIAFSVSGSTLPQ